MFSIDEWDKVEREAMRITGYKHAEQIHELREVFMQACNNVILTR